jgi:hypothetical protein
MSAEVKPPAEMRGYLSMAVPPAQPTSPLYFVYRRGAVMCLVALAVELGAIAAVGVFVELTIEQQGALFAGAVFVIGGTAACLLISYWVMVLWPCPVCGKAIHFTGLQGKCNPFTTFCLHCRKAIYEDN